jgi:hypothetical protein
MKGSVPATGGCLVVLNPTSGWQMQQAEPKGLVARASGHFTIWNPGNIL